MGYSDLQDGGNGYYLHINNCRMPELADVKWNHSHTSHQPPPTHQLREDDAHADDGHDGEWRVESVPRGGEQKFALTWLLMRFAPKDR